MSTIQNLSHRSGGFTLIELIAVVIILALVGIAALPQQIDLRSAAYKSAVDRDAMTFAAQVQTGNLKCQVDSKASSDNLAGFAAGNIDFNAGCLPVDTNGNNSALNAARCMRVWNALMAGGPSADSNVANNPVYRVQVTGGDCRFRYQADLAVNRYIYYDADGGKRVYVTNP